MARLQDCEVSSITDFLKSHNIYPFPQIQTELKWLENGNSVPNYIFKIGILRYVMHCNERNSSRPVYQGLK